MKSVYERISEAVGEDGMLPESFSLTEPAAPNQWKFADGARDGVALYHCTGGGSERLLECLKKITRQVSEGREHAAVLKELEQCFGKEAMLGSIDDLQEWIVKHSEEISAERLFHFTEQVLVESQEVEAVKYALSVLELLAGAGGEWRQSVKGLALSDELTLFCVFVARQWEQANMELFCMAKKVHGWGRIHAVEALEPENSQMQKWLLEEGWKNNILSAYSAACCAIKGDFYGRLSKEALTDSEFVAAGGLMLALFDEGPLPGISDSRLEHPEELLLLYMKHVRAQKPGFYACEVVEAIREKAGEKGWTEVERDANEILCSDSCRSTLKQSIKETGKGFRLAKKLEIAYQEELLAALEQNFSQYYTEIDLLMTEDNASCIDQVVAVCERELPAVLGTGPKDWIFAADEPRYGQLGYVIQHLKKWPGKGTVLLLTALQSPVISNRTMALNVLEAWRDAGWRETEDIRSRLLWLKDQEVEESIQKRLK